MSNSKLTPQQIDVLLRPIRPGRVATRDGQSNVEAYDIRAHLTRIFGFGRWDEIAVSTDLIYEEPTTTKAGKDAWKVAYVAHRAIRVYDHDGRFLCEHHGSAVGEAIMPDFKRGDTHDFAMKKAQSQALKRAAINLGDQFGLSLYRGGSLDPVVGRVVDVDLDTATGEVMHEPDVVPETDPDAQTPVEESPVSLPEQYEIVHDSEPQLPVVDVEPATPGQVRKIQVAFGKAGIKERDAKLARLTKITGRPITSSKDLSNIEAGVVIDALESGEPK